MSKLIIIRGNSGSGKTSVANKLQRRLERNTLIISQDVVRREMLWVNDGKDNLAIPLMSSLLRYGREHCSYVILEGILNASWYKLLFETAIREFDSEIYAYYYDISFKETLRRHESKSKKFEFGEAEMRRWWNEKDYIGLISEKTFKEDITLDCAINVICQDLSLRLIAPSFLQNQIYMNNKINTIAASKADVVYAHPLLAGGDSQSPYNSCFNLSRS